VTFYSTKTHTQFQIHLCVGVRVAKSETHIKASGILLLYLYILFYVPTIQRWLCLVLLQHSLQHWANKASIHPSITYIAIALPFSLPSAGPW